MLIGLLYNGSRMCLVVSQVGVAFHGWCGGHTVRSDGSWYGGLATRMKMSRHYEKEVECALLLVDEVKL